MQKYRIYYEDDKFKILNKGFSSFNKLIKYHQMNSINSNEIILFKDFKKIIICRAKSSFQATDNTELSFQAGDILRILNNSDQHWWQAELNNQYGLVPAQWLEITDS